MKNAQISNVKELIDFLSKYPPDTDINHLTGNKDTIKQFSSLYIVETNPIGDRDSEDIIELSFANNPNPFN